MAESDALRQSEVRRVVREEVFRAVWSILSTIFWTIVAAFTILVGLQVVQIAFYTSGLTALALAAVGVLVTGASIYLLYDLHWTKT
ncbi:MAG: hypothetical protein J07HQW1_01762 [Haloquadratum walsbyi J07HQW1]|uniref:Uncharacterized protein n=1 Tax=Haloquadratum walsbyi J07HQW1 TaxID=1238424 RepID=U1N5L8_9EURY|nr:MAG: hypothetical protein J07HQW1_01762 [Haloquadratum walsbyi J07HQW1]